VREVSIGFDEIGNPMKLTVVDQKNNRRRTVPACDKNIEVMFFDFSNQIKTNALVRLKGARVAKHFGKPSFPPVDPGGIPLRR
jgi:hypothetical protein